LLAAIEIAAFFRTKQNTQRHIDMDHPVFQELRCMTGPMDSLHNNSFLHEPCGIPIGTRRRGRLVIPMTLMKLRLREHLLLSLKTA
jgi:hypothetical protein